jgi:hypothetical protein
MVADMEVTKPLESKNEDELDKKLDEIFRDTFAIENTSQRKDEAKHQIQELISKARIDELETFIKSMSHYQTDHAYEHEPFYTVTDTDLKERINELQALKKENL